MSQKKKVILTCLIIVVDCILLVSILSVRSATMRNNLKKEIKDIVLLDVTKDRYNTKLKTSGKYGRIEKTIKTYMDDYAVLLQDVLGDIHDEKLTKILSFDNYNSDGPEFKNSLQYLKDSKTEFNNKIEKLIKNSDEKSIIAYGEANLKNSSLTSYKELVFNYGLVNNLKATQTTLYDTKVRVNNIYDTSTEVLNFLVKNKDNWKLENKEIKFKNESLYKEYTNMIKKIDTK